MNCERSEQEGKFLFANLMATISMATICLALGNKSGSFCEAVNCERSEQEGKFLFAIPMVSMVRLNIFFKLMNTDK